MAPAVLYFVDEIDHTGSKLMGDAILASQFDQKACCMCVFPCHWMEKAGIFNTW